jgi:AGCS family alanine or glycine:cation symporter
VVAVTGGDASWMADKGWLFGVVIAVLVGLVIIGGIQGIARVTSKIVPLTLEQMAERYRSGELNQIVN